MRDETARIMLTALQEGRKIKLEYEEPWYWLVGISGAERPAEAPKPGVRRMRIQLVDMIEPTKTEYALDAQQDKEVKYGADPILARAVAGNPSGQIMEKGVEAVEYDLFADIPQNYA